MPPSINIMKRYLALLGSGMFCVVCFSLYLMLESTASINGTAMEIGENDLNSIEAKIKRIETDLQKNQKTINLIKETVREIANGNNGNIEQLQKALQLDLKESEDTVNTAKATALATKMPTAGRAKLPATVVSKPAGVAAHPAVLPVFNNTHVKRPRIAVPMETCALAQQAPNQRDLQMLDVYNLLPFDNPDGGSWKQGFPITYSPTQWSEQPLKVIVVPHSHTDPGWIKTFDRYYTDQTRNIFDNMLTKLETYPQMRFIYAEMSFFSLWWAEIDHSKKQRVKRLIEENRLEIVTGGWVMNDEANAHYFAMLDQMIEGNQWLFNQLGVKPKSAWAIDPFGHSPTMAYLINGMGFNNMLIQRIHYAIKKHLAKQKALEFRWRQNWDNTGNTDILCHMMPFYSYDVPHTCGPDPKVCCQFDFKRLPGGRVTCPWKVAPVPITDTNVAEKARILLDQYRQKSTLYKNNVVLIILGDDFRFDKPIEWDQQYLNYQKLFDYMNGRKEWNVEAKFGTLSDYFSIIWERTNSKPGEAASFPSLSGDFFTYADREDHYWSGYYTSRPFYKRLDRILESHLRGAEIIFSLAVAQQRHDKVSSFSASVLMKLLVSARRSLGLYQHHDGITGTSKDFVTADYGAKILAAIKDAKRIIQDSAYFLMLQDKNTFKPENTPYFENDEDRKSHDSLPYKKVFVLDSEPRSIVFYNSLSHTRKEVVRLHVSKHTIEVKDNTGKIIPSQIDPFWDEQNVISSTVFKLAFEISVPALGLSTYSITQKEGNKLNIISKQMLINMDIKGSPGPFSIEKPSALEFSLENRDIQATLSSATGTLKSLSVKETQRRVKYDEEFVRYGTSNTKDKKSGAYLFMPNGDAKPIQYSKPPIRVSIGSLLSESTAFLPLVQHTVRLVNSDGIDGVGIHVANLVDIRSQSNQEIVMRAKTDINSQGTFYTDLNGFQIQKRQYQSKLPLQANFYPMPTMAYIQDDKIRLTILSGQSLGASSLRSGWLEVMQDRRLAQDDNRGLGQGVLDNKITPNIFRIMVEQPDSNVQMASAQPTGHPSLLTHLSSLQLIHPVIALPLKGGLPSTGLLKSLQPLQQDLPCELHVVNLRMLQNKEENPEHRFVPKNETGLLLHRLSADCAFPSKSLMCTPGNGKVTLGKLLKNVEVKSAQSTSLTFIHDEDKHADLNVPVEVPPMEIRAYKVQIR